MVTGNENPERTAYLTFDDGPSSNTVHILNILREHNIPATFFVVGSESAFAKRMYQRIVDEGHALGNHTYSHDYDKIYQSAENFMEDVVKMQVFLEGVTGARPDVFRFPAGSNNQVHRQVQSENPYIMVEILEALRKKDLQFFDWNVSSTDAAAITLETEFIIENTLNNVRGHRNAILLFHDSTPKTTTVEALPIIIQSLKAQGYTFKPLTADAYYVHFRHLVF